MHQCRLPIAFSSGSLAVATGTAKLLIKGTRLLWDAPKLSP